MSKKTKVDYELDEITGKEINGKVTRRLFSYISPFRFVAIGAMAFMFTSVGISLYSPRLLGRIVDTALVPRDKNLLLMLAALYIGLECISLAAKFLSSYLLQKIGQEILHALRQDLFGRLTRMPVSFYDKNPTGRLVTRITNDTANLMEIFGPGFVTLAAELLLALGKKSV
jgi:ATP-binding cassette, subfamily B, multidrug efflux pump